MDFWTEVVCVVTRNWRISRDARCIVSRGSIDDGGLSHGLLHEHSDGQQQIPIQHLEQIDEEEP